MTEVMNSLEPGKEDFSGGDEEQSQGAASFQERYPKLTKRLPSIVVEPTDGAEVESGELRWPPDEPSTSDAPGEKQTSPHTAPTTGDQTAAKGELDLQEEYGGEAASGAEEQDSE
ncbi:protein LBH-like isoform X2 [Lampris incognitus]|uniref:protein LBH-like isoform X2 n=1 Tax=Lampris incognitus TaxID=2546036 RepID=UPI0024B59180|nr:protein LBH-like isoform X2 [Lampris incognitus]